MNNYRLRLILATALLSVATTVLTLQLSGLLQPALPADALRLYAYDSPGDSPLSPWRVTCHRQLAIVIVDRRVLVDSEMNVDSDASTVTSGYLRDSQGRLLSCTAP